MAATNEAGLQAARAVAEWELGAAGWADLIIDAYFDPERSMARVRRERGESD